MKRFFGNTCGLIAFLAIFLACGENEDGSCNLIWSLSCLGIAVVCVWIWNKLVGDNEGKETDRRAD